MLLDSHHLLALDFHHRADVGESILQLGLQLESALPSPKFEFYKEVLLVKKLLSGGCMGGKQERVRNGEGRRAEEEWKGLKKRPYFHQRSK